MFNQIAAITFLVTTFSSFPMQNNNDQEMDRYNEFSREVDREVAAREAQAEQNVSAWLPDTPAPAQPDYSNIQESSDSRDSVDGCIIS